MTAGKSAPSKKTGAAAQVRAGPHQRDGALHPAALRGSEGRSR